MSFLVSKTYIWVPKLGAQKNQINYTHG